MKKKISVLLAIFGILFFQMAQAQTYKHKLANRSANSVEFVLSGSSITIEGYKGDQVIVKNNNYRAPSSPIPPAPPKQAKGLHRLKSVGNRTRIGLAAKEEKGTLKLTGSLSNAGNYRVKIPDKISIKVTNFHPSGDIEISNMQGEIQLRSLHANVKMQNVTGPLIISNNGGDVSIVYSRVSEKNPSSINVMGGNIDLTMPANSKANLSMISNSGDIYTDLPIHAVDHEGGMQLLSNDYRYAKGTLNGGGVELKLRALKGNIYLRKK